MAPSDMERRQDVSAATASAPPSNTTLYLSVGVGVGVAILIAIAGVVLRIVMKKKQHQRAVAEMEQGRVGAAISPSRNMQQLPRLATGARCGPHTQHGWDGLGSSETLNEPGAKTNPKQLRSSISLPKKFKNRGIQFGRNKYLSAIVELESPVSENTSPEIPQQQTMEQLMASSNGDNWDQSDNANQEMSKRNSAQTISPASVLELLALYTGRSPYTPGAAAVNENPPNKATRSASAGVLDSIPDGAVFGKVDRDSFRMRNPDTRARSLSLGAPISQPPSIPVPPLPVRSPHRLVTNLDNNDDDTRQGVCISRMSSSSIDSASSSVLVTSPILTRNNDDEALHSPTLEDVVAEDEHASLKTVPNRQWENPRISGPRPNTSTSPSKMQKSGSFRGSIIRFSSDSIMTRTLSNGSTSSEGSIRKKRMSIAQIGTANSIVMSRVSSNNSLHGSVGVQKVTTPTRKMKRQSSVSANGSPAERKRPGVLRDISGNANKFSANRESSDSTLNSGRSSCGNPFQWDPSAATLNVPSALKGSPNARKRHRRQNCVRISTLTPQVLGPAARSRSASPVALMQRIKEERESDEFRRSADNKENEMQLVVQKRRPGSIRSTTLPGNLRVQTLRASFTPDAPNSSILTPREQAGLKSTASDSNLSVSSTGSKSGSRRSDDGSSGVLVIPQFPTPSKATASPAAMSQATALPQFSMDFADDDNDEQSRFALASSPSSSEPSPVSPLSPGSPTSRISQVSPIAFQLPSSPPDHMSAKKEYDPAWPVINLPMPGEAEYDPASPPSMIWDPTDPARSSWFLPFAAGNMFNEPGNNTNNRVQELSPPCSPKSSPKPPDNSPEGETLTSSNASKMMSLIPASATTTTTSKTSSGALGLPSIPILLPPTTSEDPAYQLPEWKPPTTTTHHPTAPRPRRVTSTGSPTRIRRRSPEPFLPTIPQSSSPPQAPAFHTVRPLNIPAGNNNNNNNNNNSNSKPTSTSTTPRNQSPTPKGPRTAPAKSVLNNVSALRRMNSDANSSTPNRQSRNWQRLGREASPALPYTGAVLLPREESSNSLFDFDFGTRTSGVWRQSVGGASSNGEGEGEKMGIAIGDDVDVDERSFSQVLDGALAGFHAEFKSLGAGDGESDGHKRVSSVWDDGEQFWEQEKQSRAPSFQLHSAAKEKDDAATTPRRSATDSICDPNLLSTSFTGRQMSSPLAMAVNTPKSLYDADGFLKA